eukprot:13408116-Alexandrium_andersonii.AAC.1
MPRYRHRGTILLGENGRAASASCRLVMEWAGTRADLTGQVHSREDATSVRAWAPSCLTTASTTGTGKPRTRDCEPSCRTGSASTGKARRAWRTA